jgi:hypothetical protein
MIGSQERRVDTKKSIAYPLRWPLPRLGAALRRSAVLFSSAVIFRAAAELCLAGLFHSAYGAEGGAARPPNWRSLS